MTAQRVISFLVPTGLLIIGLLLQGCDPSTDKSTYRGKQLENHAPRWSSSTMAPITKAGKYPQYIEQYVDGIQDDKVFIGDGQQYFTNEGSHPQGKRQIKNKSHGGDFEQHTIQHTGGYHYHTKQYDSDEENYTLQESQRATQSQGDDNQQNISVDEHAVIETDVPSSIDELMPMASLTAFARTIAPWSLSAVVISMCFCLLWWAIPCFFIRATCMSTRMGPASQLQSTRPAFVRREVRLMMLTTVLASVSALAASQFTAGRNVPTAMDATVLLPLVRTSWIDKQLTGSSFKDLLKEDYRAFPKSPFIMSKLEVFDAFTDGIAIAQAIRLDINNESFHKRWVESWEQGPYFSRCLAPLARTLRLPGWMISAQASAMLFQFAISHMPFKELERTAAQIAGLGAFSERGATLPEEDLHLKYLFALVKDTSQVLFEAAPQLALQLSLFMASGMPLGLDGATGPVTVSICIGIAMTLKKAVGMLMNAFGQPRSTGLLRNWFFPVLAPLLSFAILAWTVAWLIGLEVCPEHSFNVSAMQCDHFDS